MIISCLRNTNTGKGFSCMSFHGGIDMSFRGHYLDTCANDEFRYLLGRYFPEEKNGPHMNIECLIIPLSEEEVDEYVETGKFHTESVRDAIEAIGVNDTSGYLESLL